MKATFFSLIPALVPALLLVPAAICQPTWFLGLVAAIAVMEHVARPRIVRRRMEAEMRLDPEWASTRRRKERRQAVLGWTLGLIGGMAGLTVGLWFSQHGR